MASHGVDFIDENDARSVLLPLLEQIAHAARADTHEHLHKIRTGDRKEGNVRLPSYGSSKKRLASTGRSNQQHSLGNSAAQLLKFLRLAQEFDNLAELFLSLFHAGHVLERDFLLLHREQARAALAE